MILRHVTDVIDLVEDPAEDWTMPATGQSRNQDDDQTNAMHIQDDASEKLLEWRATEDTPEVFKRVRFLTQWYDAEDSRDTCYDRLGQLKIWGVVGSAKAHKEHLVLMSAQILGHAIFKLYDEDAALFVNMWFMGTHRHDSVPVFIIYSKSKQNREQTLRAAREIPWFRTSSIKIATCFAAKVRDKIIRQGICDPDEI
jgi:hypothetical protein